MPSMPDNSSENILSSPFSILTTFDHIAILYATRKEILDEYIQLDVYVLFVNLQISENI